MCRVLKMIAEAEVDQTWPSLGCGVGAILTIYLEPYMGSESNRG